jgi:D-alanyl-D-alanine carboxypeptidase
VYSNTGYLILGKIIEQVTERPYHEVINEDVVGRLGQTSLAALSPGPAPSGVAFPMAEGHSPSITTPFAAGAMIGTALDMAIAWKRFLAGDLIPQPRVRQMFETLYPTNVPDRAYGLGVMAWRRTRSADGTSNVWLGHRGSIDGARALVVWSLNHKAVVAVALTGEGDVEAIAQALLDAAT